MKQTKILMGMPIIVEVVDKQVKKADLNAIYDYFKLVDEKFSTYKSSSEISKINDLRLMIKDSSREMRKIFKLAEQTKQQTNGFFDIQRNGSFDPSGIVKGWAIDQAAKLIKQKGFNNFYINAGGDIQSSGKNKSGKNWTVGIRNPFKTAEIIKVVTPRGKGIATSGTYERGRHIWSKQQIEDIVSLTVIGPNIYEADRFATAAFAMGKSGINFIEQLSGFEGYMIDKAGMATYTSGFERFVA